MSCMSIHPKLFSLVYQSTDIMHSLLLLVVCFCFQLQSGATEVKDEAQLKWTRMAEQELQRTLIKLSTISVKRAKNLVLFVGDGMGISTVAVARALKAHLNGKLIGEEVIAFEEIHFATLAKTYDADKGVSDSAATATALWCGVKTTDGTIGVDERVKFANCSTYSRSSDLKCLSHHAKEAGKATAIVTTTTVTHATPAPGYAHSPHRDWETNEKDRPKSRNPMCKDIASQFVDIGNHVDILLGGGANYFDGRIRADGRDLKTEWLEKRKKDSKKKPFYVSTKYELAEAVSKGATDLLGLFSPTYLAWGAGKNDSTKQTQPTLAEMVGAAIDVLRQNENGFLLFVEGGQIDWGHHVNMAGSAVEEVFGLEAAFKMAMQKTSLSDTLIVVTADHSHTLSMGGQPSRSVNILEKAEEPSHDGMPYTYLIYANGPSGLLNTTRKDISAVNTTIMDYQQQSLVRLRMASHGGEDVAVYAGGPMAHMFTDVREQHSIPHFMMYAACIGPWKDDCALPNHGAKVHLQNYCSCFALSVLLLIAIVYL